MKTRYPHYFAAGAVVLALLFALVVLTLVTPAVQAQEEPAPPVPWADEIPPMLPDALAAEVGALPASEPTASPQMCAANYPDQGPYSPEKWALMAFSSFRDQNWEIYAAQGDGRIPRRLTWSEAADLRPAISPDGKWIAFDSNDGADVGREVLLVPYQGGALTTLIDTPAGAGVGGAASDYAPAWSLDGKRVAFVSTRDGNAEIYEITVGTGVQRRITFNDNPDYDPSYNQKTGELYWARAADSLRGAVYGLVNGVESQISGAIGLLERPLLDADGWRLGYTGDITGDGWGDLVLPPDDGSPSFTQTSWEDSGGRASSWQLDAYLTLREPGMTNTGDFAIGVKYMALGSEIYYVKIKGVWYLQHATMWGWGFTNCSYWDEMLNTVNLFGDIISLDHEAPKMGIRYAPGVGTIFEITMFLMGDDGADGSGLAFYQVEEDSSQGEPRKRNVSPGDVLANPNRGCGEYSIRARAVDQMGFTSPWAVDSNLKYQLSSKVSVYDLWNIPLGGMEIGNPNPEIAAEAAGYFGKRITGAEGTTTYFECEPDGMNGLVLRPSVLTAGWTTLSVRQEGDALDMKFLVTPPASSHILAESFDGTPEQINEAWNLDFPVVKCDKSEVLGDGYSGTDCLKLGGNAPAPGPDRLLTLERSIAIPPERATDAATLLIHEYGYNVNYSPRVYISTSESPEKTLVSYDSEDMLTSGIARIPLDMALGDAITVTYQLTDQAGSDGAWILDSINIVPRYSPAVGPYEVASAIAAVDGTEVAATSVVTITGENFLAPVKVDLDGVTAAQVEYIDSQTVRATFASVPPGLHTLWVTNRAGMPEQLRTEAPIRLAQDVRVYIPLLQYRGTQLPSPYSVLYSPSSAPVDVTVDVEVYTATEIPVDVLGSDERPMDQQP